MHVRDGTHPADPLLQRVLRRVSGCLALRRAGRVPLHHGPRPPAGSRCGDLPPAGVQRNRRCAQVSRPAVCRLVDGKPRAHADPPQPSAHAPLRYTDELRAGGGRALHLFPQMGRVAGGDGASAASEGSAAYHGAVPVGTEGHQRAQRLRRRTDASSAGGFLRAIPQQQRHPAGGPRRGDQDGPAWRLPLLPRAGEHLRGGLRHREILPAAAGGLREGLSGGRRTSRPTRRAITATSVRVLSRARGAWPPTCRTSPTTRLPMRAISTGVRTRCGRPSSHRWTWRPRRSSSGSPDTSRAGCKRIPARRMPAPRRGPSAGWATRARLQHLRRRLAG